MKYDILAPRCRKNPKFKRRYPIIVMEKMAGGDLFDVLKAKSDLHDAFSGKRFLIDGPN